MDVYSVHILLPILLENQGFFLKSLEESTMILCCSETSNEINRSALKLFVEINNEIMVD